MPTQIAYKIGVEVVIVWGAAIVATAPRPWRSHHHAEKDLDPCVVEGVYRFL